MTDDAPKIASTLERTKLLMGASLMCLQVPLILERMNPFGVLIFLGGLSMTLDAIRVLSTQVTALCVSQLTWRGRIQMRWVDITTVTRRNRSIVLTSSHGRIVVPTESFYDTRAAVDFLDSHLPRKVAPIMNIDAAPGYSQSVRTIADRRLRLQGSSHRSYPEYL